MPREEYRVRSGNETPRNSKVFDICNKQFNQEANW